MGGWIREHVGCGAMLLFCNMLSHDLFTVDAHDVVPERYGAIGDLGMSPSAASRGGISSRNGGRAAGRRRPRRKE